MTSEPREATVMSMNLEPMTQTPRKAADLERIEARLERIEAMLARFDAAANLVPSLVAMTSDIAVR